MAQKRKMRKKWRFEARFKCQLPVASCQALLIMPVGANRQGSPAQKLQSAAICCNLLQCGWWPDRGTPYRSQGRAFTLRDRIVDLARLRGVRLFRGARSVINPDSEPRNTRNTPKVRRHNVAPARGLLDLKQGRVLKREAAIFGRDAGFSRLTDCADCGIGGNRAFTQLICEKWRSYL